MRPGSAGLRHVRALSRGKQRRSWLGLLLRIALVFGGLGPRLGLGQFGGTPRGQGSEFGVIEWCVVFLRERGLFFLCLPDTVCSSIFFSFSSFSSFSSREHIRRRGGMPLCGGFS